MVRRCRHIEADLDKELMCAVRVWCVDDIIIITICPLLLVLVYVNSSHLFVSHVNLRSTYVYREMYVCMCGWIMSVCFWTYVCFVLVMMI